jgi:hypothetical protein
MIVVEEAAAETTAATTMVVAEGKHTVLALVIQTCRGAAR